MHRVTPSLSPLDRIDLSSVRRPPLPAYARVAILWAAWYPFLASFLYLGRFVPIFDKLHEHGILLPLSAWFLRLSHLDDDASHLLFPALMIALAVGDLAVGRFRGRALYRVWFAAVVISAVVAFLLCATAALFPYFRISRGP